MNLQVTIIGLFIIAVFYVCTGWLLVFLERLTRPRHWRWVVVVPLGIVVLALPWVDEVWIAWHFNELCKDAGVHIARTVEVEGFLNDTSRSSSDHLKGHLVTDSEAVKDFDRDGYRYKESMLNDGKVWHLERVTGGVQASILDKPTARYRFKKPRNDEDVGYQLEAIEYVVIDSETNEVIGRRAIYKRYPGWVNTLWIRYIGSGMTMCPDPEQGPPQPLFPESVLIPARVK